VTENREWVRGGKEQIAGGKEPVAKRFICYLLLVICSLFLGCSGPADERPLSSDAALQSLHIEGQDLIPDFNPEITAYTVVADYSTTSLAMSAEPRSPDATVNGAGALDDLAEGETLRDITVTAQDGVAQKTYALVIVRLDPQGFGPAAEPPFLVPGPGEGLLTVQWSAVWGAESYEVLYGTEDDISGAQSLVPEAESLSCVIEGIAKGRDYYVWVRAWKEDASKTLPPANTLLPAAFASFEALAAFLESAPQNSAASPYFVTMSGLTTADLNKVIDGVDVSLGALFSALRGRYAAADLSALAGPTIPAVSVQATMDRNRLTGVVLPEGLEDLGADVFRNCSSLVSVEFGGNLVSIGDRAFQSSGLKTLELPDSLQTIGAYAFAETALETLELSPGLTSIGDYAFSCRNLTRVDFREGASISEGLRIKGAFANCGALKSARLPDSLDSLSYDYSDSFNNCPALELLSMPATTNSIGASLAEASTSIRFEVRGTGKFGTALEGRVLTQLAGTVWITAPGLGGGDIEVPEGVIEIAQNFFAGNTGLTGITLPSTLTVINESMFQACSALERATIKGAISSIGDLAFFGCSSLGSIILPESLRYIGANAFRHSGLRSITVPSRVEEYGLDTQSTIFANCPSLEYADIRTPHLAPFMFIGCGELREISLAPETKEIPAHTFEGCVKLEKINPSEDRDINLPPGLELIRLYAFSNCSALGGELELPPGVRAIENSAVAKYTNPFYGCTGITRLILPRSLEGDLISAFAGADFVDSFGLNGTGEVWKVSPEGKLLIQGDAVYWTARTLGDVTIPAGVRDYTLLAGKTSLTGLVFEEDPERASIPENAFSGCVSLVRATLSSGVRAINNYAFNGCRALEELAITNTASTALTYPVAATVFRNCSALKSIKVPQELVETYKANRYWQIKPSGVANASYLSDIITDNR
jgi:hypothetical protein